jgi:hypothetical protein
LLYGRHGAPHPALPHTTISQYAAQQVYVVKNRKQKSLLLLINYEKARCIVNASCLCLPVAAAAGGQFWPTKSFVYPSLHL